jgi:carbonic anhydrase/SulP family sulfate permease
MGHTRCGAVTTAVKLAGSSSPVAQTTGCQNVEPILHDIQESIDPQARARFDESPKDQQEAYVNQVAKQNVQRTVQRIFEESETLANLAHEGRIAIVGAMYDVTSGEIEFLNDPAGKN